jgi:hypothetical protein
VDLEGAGGGALVFPRAVCTGAAGRGAAGAGLDARAADAGAFGARKCTGIAIARNPIATAAAPYMTSWRDGLRRSLRRG